MTFLYGARLAVGRNTAVQLGKGTEVPSEVGSSKYDKSYKVESRTVGSIAESTDITDAAD